MADEAPKLSPNYMRIHAHNDVTRPSPAKKYRFNSIDERASHPQPESFKDKVKRNLNYDFQETKNDNWHTTRDFRQKFKPILEQERMRNVPLQQNLNDYDYSCSQTSSTSEGTNQNFARLNDSLTLVTDVPRKIKPLQPSEQKNSFNESFSSSELFNGYTNDKLRQWKQNAENKTQMINQAKQNITKDGNLQR